MFRSLALAAILIVIPLTGPATSLPSTVTEVAGAASAGGAGELVAFFTFSEGSEGWTLSGDASIADEGWPRSLRLGPGGVARSPSLEGLGITTLTLSSWYSPSGSTLRLLDNEGALVARASVVASTLYVAAGAGAGEPVASTVSGVRQWRISLGEASISFAFESYAPTLVKTNGKPVAQLEFVGPAFGALQVDHIRAWRGASQERAFTQSLEAEGVSVVDERPGDGSPQACAGCTGARSQGFLTLATANPLQPTETREFLTVPAPQGRHVAHVSFRPTDWFPGSQVDGATVLAGLGDSVGAGPARWQILAAFDVANPTAPFILTFVDAEGNRQTLPAVTPCAACTLWYDLTVVSEPGSLTIWLEKEAVGTFMLSGEPATHLALGDLSRFPVYGLGKSGVMNLRVDDLLVAPLAAGSLGTFG